MRHLKNVRLIALTNPSCSECPQVNKLWRGKWHPEDLIDPLPGQDSEWRQALWDRAQCCLTRDGIVISDLSFARSQAERTAPGPQ